MCVCLFVCLCTCITVYVCTGQCSDSILTLPASAQTLRRWCVPSRFGMALGPLGTHRCTMPKLGLCCLNMFRVGKSQEGLRPHVLTQVLRAREHISVFLAGHIFLGITVLQKWTDLVKRPRRPPIVCIWAGHCPGQDWRRGQNRSVELSNHSLVWECISMFNV